MKELFSEEWTFKTQRAFQIVALDEGAIIMQPDRVQLDYAEKVGRQLVRAVVRYLVQEDLLYRYPADWWQAIKERWFSPWLQSKTPVRYTEVWAVHKFPELSVPDQLLGREFVHVKIVDPDEVDRMVKDEKDS